MRVKSSKPISSERLRRNMNNDVLNYGTDISDSKYGKWVNRRDQGGAPLGSRSPAGS